MIFLYWMSSVLYPIQIHFHFHLVLAWSKKLKCHELRSYPFCSLASCRLFTHPDMSLQFWAGCLLTKAIAPINVVFCMHCSPSDYAKFLSCTPTALRVGLHSFPSLYYPWGIILSLVVFLHDILIDNPFIKLSCIILTLLHHLFLTGKLFSRPPLSLTTGQTWRTYLLLPNLILVIWTID